MGIYHRLVWRYAQFKMHYSNNVHRIILRNLIALGMVLTSFWVVFNIWELPFVKVPIVILMHYFALAAAVLGAFLILNITIKSIKNFPGTTGLIKARHFFTGLAFVLFSYAVAWHLPFDYFRYALLGKIYLVVLIASIQAYIWGSEAQEHKQETFELANRWAWLLPVLILSLAFFLVNLIISLRTVRFEDVFITFRYGWNLAHGHGINWNVLDPVPTEGYTTFTFVLLSALFFKSGLNPLIGMQIINLLSLSVFFYFMWQIGRDVSEKNNYLRSTLSLAIYCL
jgi:hypothetical protein